MLENVIKKLFPIRDGKGRPCTFPTFGSQVFGEDEEKRALWQADRGFYADDSRKFGGKAPEYYLQPRNLLDNSDFRNPVNQRSIASGASIAAYSYFIDRWVNQTSEKRSFTLSASGIGLPLATTLLQKIENIQEGKVVTFAIKLSDGTISTLTGTVQYASDLAWTRFASVTHSFGDMYMETMSGLVHVVVYNTEVITIEWAALYEGDYTAETLPPYVPKGYSAELMECKRYYQPFKQNAFLGFAKIDLDKINYQGMIPCVDMRVEKPQIVGELAVWNGITPVTISTVTLWWMQGNGIRINGKLASELTAGETVAIYSFTSVAFSADLL